MKLSSPAFERHLRRKARNELRQSRLLWKDYRQHKARWWRRNRNLNVGIGSIYVLAILFSVVVHSGRPLVVLTVIALYASGTALFRSSTHFARASRGFDRAVLIALPISDDEFVKHESRTLFRSWVGAFAVFGSAYGIYAAVCGDFWREFPAVLAASILQALTGLSLGSAVVGLRPKMVGASLIMPFYGLMLLCVFYLPEDISRFLWSAILVTPAGWVAHGFAGIVGAARASEQFWLIPAFVVAAMLPLSLRALRSQILAAIASPDYAFDRVFVPKSDDRREGEVNPTTEGPINDLQPVALEGPFAQEAKTIDWIHLGQIVRMVASVLNTREKVVAEFMLGNDLRRWSKSWRSAALITLFGAAATLAIPTLPSWIFFIPMIVAASMSAPLVGGAWCGFKGPLTSGFLLPAYSVFPLSYAEISWVMMKTNCVRILTWAPLAIVYSSALAYRLSDSPIQGAILGIQAVCLVLALQPLFIAGHFSAGTNDTKQVNWHSLLFLTVALGILGVILVSGFMMFIVKVMLIKAAAMAILFGSSGVAWLAYKWFFERGRIDLLARPGGQ